MRSAEQPLAPRERFGRIVTADFHRSGQPDHASTLDRQNKQPGLAVQRLLAAPRLHVAFRRLHCCGPQPVGMFVAELLDHIGADPTTIDLVLTWVRLDPDIVRTLAGEFPPSPLDQVA
jgi:hypothetical protein